MSLFYQDIRYRKVYWIAFPVLLGLLVYQALLSLPVEAVISHMLINLIFLVSQLILLTAYFTLKSGKLINITQSLIGWGDLLFLFTLTIYPSPLNYLSFYMGSLSNVPIH